jgi:hypothetical protein
MKETMGLLSSIVMVEKDEYVEWRTSMLLGEKRGGEPMTPLAYFVTDVFKEPVSTDKRISRCSQSIS